jgi:hypothetical protein
LGIQKARGLYARQLCDLLEFHWFAAQAKINTHNPAGPTATRPCYVGNESVELFESNIFPNADAYRTLQFRLLFWHFIFLSGFSLNRLKGYRDSAEAVFNFRLPPA